MLPDQQYQSDPSAIAQNMSSYPDEGAAPLSWIPSKPPDRRVTDHVKFGVYDHQANQMIPCVAEVGHTPGEEVDLSVFDS